MRPKETPNDPGLVVGLTPVLAALKARGKDAKDLWVAKTRKGNPDLTAILARASELKLNVKWVERKDLDLKTDLPHQGVAARFLPRPSLSLTALLATIDPNDPALLLILDHLEDPHNLGALWRTAAALGVKALIAPKDRAATLSTTVYKVAAGGAEALPLITVVNLNRAIEELKKRDFWVVGAEGATGQNLWDFTFPRRTALLLGSEGQGVSRLLKESADFLVHIPLTGPVTSLNVSAAGAILMGAYCRGLGRP